MYPTYLVFGTGTTRNQCIRSYTSLSVGVATTRYNAILMFIRVLCHEKPRFFFVHTYDYILDYTTRYLVPGIP